MISIPNEIDELIKHYFVDPKYTVDDVPFGLTNVTKIIEVEKKKYVIRIYNKHIKEAQGIDFEAKVLSFLTDQEPSFTLPLFLKTLSGKKYVQLKSGKLGAIITYLDGHVPVLSDMFRVFDYGKLAGEFSKHINKLNVHHLEHRGKSFVDYYTLHPLADKKSVMSFITSPPIPISEDRLTFLETERSKAEIDVLPVQLVHHDLLIYNLLSNQNQITGVLDFDFISVDVSFLEFIICLHHIIQESSYSLESVEIFIKGYASFRNHSLMEISKLSILSQVYFIAVLNIYIGQYHSGVNIEGNFNFILNQFFRSTEWLEKNEKMVLETMKLYLVEQK